MIAILGRDDLREQPGSGDAAILERVQGCGDGCGKGVVATHIGRPHDAPAQEARGLVVDLPGDFLADAPPRLRAGFDRLGIDYLLDHRQVLGHARLALLTRRRCFHRAPWSLRGHGLRRFWAFIEALQKQQQLPRIELLTARAKEPPCQCVELLPQQLHLLQRPVALTHHTGKLPG